MKIVILDDSPRANGNAAATEEAFARNCLGIDRIDSPRGRQEVRPLGWLVANPAFS